jgi:hypothetical protein
MNKKLLIGLGIGGALLLLARQSQAATAAPATGTAAVFTPSGGVSSGGPSAGTSAPAPSPSLLDSIVAAFNGATAPAPTASAAPVPTVYNTAPLTQAATTAGYAAPAPVLAQPVQMPNVPTAPVVSVSAGVLAPAPSYTYTAPAPVPSASGWDPWNTAGSYAGDA